MMFVIGFCAHLVSNNTLTLSETFFTTVTRYSVRLGKSFDRSNWKPQSEVIWPMKKAEAVTVQLMFDAMTYSTKMLCSQMTDGGKTQDHCGERRKCYTYQRMRRISSSLITSS